MADDCGCPRSIRCGRKSQREEPLGAHVPDPIMTREDRIDPEQEALLAESVGLAQLVVLEALTPAERLAFVLSEMFDVPYEEIALPGSKAIWTQRAARVWNCTRQISECNGSSASPRPCAFVSTPSSSIS